MDCATTFTSNALFLPEGVDSLDVTDLPINGTTIDLRFRRLGEEVVAVPVRHTEAGVRVLGHL